MFLKRIKKNKTLIVFIFTFFIIEFIFSYIPLFMVAKNQQNIKHPILLTILYAIKHLLFFIGIIIVATIILYLLTKIAKHTVRYSKLSKTDFIQSKELYRDIINNYSAVSLSYIDQMNYNEDIAITAGILSLEKKGYLTIKNNMIEKLKFNTEGLDLPEQYIYDSIKADKIVINKQTLLKYTIKECQDKGLLEEVKNKKEEPDLDNHQPKNNNSTSLPFTLMVIFLILIHDVLESKYGIWANLFSLFALFPFIVIAFSQSELFSNKRTQKGKELNMQLEGLKSFLKNYSKLEESEADEIVLWDDYLIYSVIFKHNKKIVNEYKNYFVVY